ncbi:purine/pyrimidine permease [Halobacillus shinanisalinarum]|uniref:Purine/pyrimidine permease n=1 Tax=Halobacillus shinanisalinarum TaxID=2932258 RepID=A0ABY4H511_9BACI|nr:purine/pyrimidine permease [Halobacillus shinanisalinarum]UOQ95563.1 purine/pyrimidine permease [Halobacillus shinanisalinarum]
MAGNNYDTRSSLSGITLETVQWFVFLLASAVALPIVIGSVFQLNFTEVAGLMQRTFFVVGITSFLQGVFGHRLPIMEGPAGIWISIFTVMAYSEVAAGKSYAETLQTLEAAMIWTGIFLLFFGVFRLAHRVLFVFTPFVTGAFLFLLTVQLSGTFLKGMLGVQQQIEAILVDQTILAFLTFFVVIGLSFFGKGWLKSYAVLLGIVAGWGLYAILIGSKTADSGPAPVPFALPELWAWGMPSFNWSVIPLAFITAVILLSNIVASVVAVSHSIYGKPSYTYSQLNRGSSFLGVTHVISTMFSTVSNVSLASSSGFINLTGQKSKQPFLYASLLLVVVAFFPPIVAFISAIPAPIANAALLATFVQLMGLGLSNMMSEELNERRLTILGISFLVGIGLMFIPSEVFQGMPSIVQNLISNGLLVGTVLVIVLEQLWRGSPESQKRENA